MSFTHRFDPPTDLDFEEADGYCEHCGFCDINDYCHLMVGDDV